MKKSLSRRRLLTTGAASASAALLTPHVSWSSEASKFDLQNLERLIADKVRSLAGGKALTLNALIPDGSAGNVAPVAEAFLHATGVKLQLIEVPLDDINTRMLIDAMARRGEFDIALPATFGMPDLVEAGALLNLDALSQKYQPTNYNQGALYTLGNFYNGSFYGYQTDGDVYLMFYNYAMLSDPVEQARFEQKHGRSLEVAKTWSQLDSLMEHFHEPEKERYGGALFRTRRYIAWEFWMRLHAKGLLPFDDEMEPLIDGALGEQALEDLIRASQWQHPSAGTNNGVFENWKVYGEGNIFCNLGWGGTQKYLNGPNSKVAGKLKYSQTPGGIVDGELLPVSYFNWGWNYTVSNFSSSPEIAYLFTLFACGPKMSTVAVRNLSGFFDPFRIEHYDDPEIITAYSTEFLEIHGRAMKTSIPDLYLSGQGEYLIALQECIYRANIGEITAKSALAECANDWRRITRSRGRSQQIRQWAFLRGKYPKSG